MNRNSKSSLFCVCSEETREEAVTIPNQADTSMRRVLHSLPPYFCSTIWTFSLVGCFKEEIPHLYSVVADKMIDALLPDKLFRSSFDYV